MRHALLQIVWTEMCVGSVWTQPPCNDKDPPSVFFLKLIKLRIVPSIYLNAPFLRKSFMIQLHLQKKWV